MADSKNTLDYTRAKAHAERLLVSRPDDPTPLGDLARCYLEREAVLTEMVAKARRLLDAKDAACDASKRAGDCLPDLVVAELHDAAAPLRSLLARLSTEGK